VFSQPVARRSLEPTKAEGEIEEPLGGVLSYVAQIIATTKEEFEAFKVDVEKNAKEQEEGLGEEDEEDEEKPEKNGKANKKRARDEEENEEDDEEDEEDDEMEGIDEAKFLELLGMADQEPNNALVEVKVSDTALVNSLLKSVLEARFALYPSSLEEDDKLIKDNNFRSKHQRYAVIARAQEKRLLKSLIASL
jgi:hypothetical protein